MFGLLRRARRALPAPSGRRPADDNDAARQPTAWTGLRTPFALAGRGEGRTVLVLARGAPPARVRRWLAHLSGDEVVVAAAKKDPRWRLEEYGARFERAGGRAALRRLVYRLPPLHGVVSLVPVPRLLSAFRTTFPALRVEGFFVHDRVAAPGSIRPLADAVGFLGGRPGSGKRRARQRTMAAAVGQFVAAPNLAAVRKKQTTLLKLREADVEELLPRREPDVSVEVLTELDPGACTGTGTVDPGDFGSGRFPRSLSHPALRCRVYEGPVVLGGNSLVYAGTTALPDSFRWHLTKSPQSPALHNLDPNFGVLARSAVPRQHLPGMYYSVDSTFAHHYGHLMSEVISRLWGWDEAKRRYPDLKAAFVRKPNVEIDTALERTLFAAYGIAPEDLVVLDGPTSVDAVVSATPMWHHTEPFYVHPGMRETIDRLAKNLTAGAPRGGPSKIFVSRGESIGGRRVCRNRADVERFFAEHGFAIVYPEEHHLAEQAQLFRDARVVAGFGGSGMFNMMFAEELEHVIVLNHESYRTLNEHMFSMLLGNDEHYFWSNADREQPEDSFRDLKAFQSQWDFDFERNRDRLGELLRNC